MGWWHAAYSWFMEPPRATEGAAALDDPGGETFAVECCSGRLKSAAIGRQHSHALGIQLVPIDRQRLQFGRFDETETVPTNGRERVARVSGQFTFQFMLGHESKSFAKRERTDAASAQHFCEKIKVKALQEVRAL